MPSRTKRFRGERTHGRGKKHGRGKGHRGGSGMAGLHKHKFKWMLKYDPDHFGQSGFVRHAATAEEKACINLAELEEHLPQLEAEGLAVARDDGYDVDLTKAGVDKLLGTGRATRVLRIRVAEATSRAEERVVAAGGEVIRPETEG